jgi:DNA-binding response OmpR family regulator
MADRGLILIAEAAQDHKTAMQKNLEERGFQVKCIDTIVEAFDAFQAKNISLVLCEIKNPGEDGFDFLKSLRNSFSKDIPVILITAYPSRESVLLAKKLNVQEYLVKPVAFDRLLSSVRKLLPHDESIPQIESNSHVFSNLRVLVTTDDAHESAALCKALQQIGVHCFVAEDWFHGMKIMQAQNPNVLFLSTSLKDVNAATMIHRLSGREKEARRMFVLVEGRKKIQGSVPPEISCVLKMNDIEPAKLAGVLSQYAASV